MIASYTESLLTSYLLLLLLISYCFNSYGDLKLVVKYTVAQDPKLELFCPAIAQQQYQKLKVQQKAVSFLFPLYILVLSIVMCRSRKDMISCCLVHQYNIWLYFFFSFDLFMKNSVFWSWFVFLYLLHRKTCFNCYRLKNDHGVSWSSLSNGS